MTRAAARGAKEGNMVVSTVNEDGATTKSCGKVISGGVRGGAGNLPQQAVF